MIELYVFYMTDHVLSNDAAWKNVLFYKCCHHKATFRNTSNMGDGNVEITLLLISFLL
jgi:hypothetical protein